MKFISKMKESTTNINKVRDTQNININLEENDEIASSYISYIDADNDEVTITLEAKEGLYEETLKSLIGENINSKGDLIKILTDLGKGKGEYKSIESALKQVHQTGYSVVLPTIDDMHLEKPEIIKQGNRYGIKLKAKATSIHMIKVDVESSFEPIIGSELQSKELIEYIMKDKDDPSKIWQSEIFGRNMGEIVGEGIQAKLALLPDNAKFKLSQTITKMVNKGSNNLIALVL
jgi:stage IV sporulation protein A